jgi:hypothetical protein
LIFEKENDTDDDSSLWLEVTPYSASSSVTQIRGWLAPPYISYQSGWEVLIDSIEKPPVSAHDRGLEYFEDHGKRHPDQRLIVGAINLQTESMVLLWKRMFSLV